MVFLSSWNWKSSFKPCLQTFFTSSISIFDVFDICIQQGKNIECKFVESSSFLHQVMVKVITVSEERVSQNQKRERKKEREDEAR